jgi:hypothetical protein
VGTGVVRDFPDNRGRAALDFKEAHFRARVVVVFTNIVGDNLFEGHRCSLGRIKAHISSSWNVRIPFSTFFQKYSACLLAPVFHALAIGCGSGYDGDVA